MTESSTGELMTAGPDRPDWPAPGSRGHVGFD